MHFRPYPVLTLLAVPILGLLLWLGTWQASRAEWKRGLIDAFREQAAAPPRLAAEALCEAGVAEGAVTIQANSVHALAPASPDTKPLRMFGPSSAGQPGWALLTAFQPPECAVAGHAPVLVETGFEPLEFGPLPVTGSEAAERYIVTAWPGKSAFAAENDAAANDWHWFDAPAMARALGVAELNDRYYLKAFHGELPDRFTRTPPATHYGYAATWFGMAAAFILIYGAFHMRAGRLRFGKSAADGSP
jgi:surfeit locus 1 family protein